MPDSQRKFDEVRFQYSTVFPEILSQLRLSLLVSTYQAGKLLVIGELHGKLSVSLIDFDQPMGVAANESRIAIGSRRQIHFLNANHAVAPTIEPMGDFDGCFVPSWSSYTGNIHGHELAWCDKELWIVNTLFSCLCTLDERYSFVPRWKPKFVSQLIDQDRCHLNGLAIQDGKPRFVTAHGESDAPGGWRPSKRDGGIVIDVLSNEVLCRGLSMPHSPRIYQEKLWLLNSGEGELITLDPSNGKTQTISRFPGYTRGLCFVGQFAIVGLSQIRETSVFGGLPIAEQRDELKCGIAIFDLLSGNTVATFQFQNGVTEIFAVDAIKGIKNPLLAGSQLHSNEKEVWIVPQGSDMV